MGRFLIYDKLMEWQTIGFENIKKVFLNLHKKNALGHAYLFSGQDMIGKRTFALELVKTLNDINSDPEKHPDVFYISKNGESKILIEETRNLKKFVHLKPFLGPYKFAVIDNAHNITQEAGNSILKTLEEPPANSILILISSRPSEMLGTIVSRCENIRFNPHNPEALKDYFSKLGLSRRQVEFLADFSNGRIGMAIGLHKNNSFHLIRKIIEDFHKLVKMPIHQRFQFVAELLGGKREYDVRTALLYWMLYLRSPISDKLKISKPAMLKTLSELSFYADQPQLNHKLIFENKFLTF